MQHSDLEVVHGGISESDPGIQVRVETGMIPVRQHYELEVADSGGRSNDGSTPEATELMSKEQIMEKGKWSFKAFSRRQRWLVIGETLTLVLLIVLASILGVVMNSREHKSLSPSTTSPTAEDTSTSILASASASGSASPPTTQSTATGTASSNLIRNIAAVSHTSNSVNITRLYYQDGSGQLIEATTSDSSSSTTPTWTTNKLNYTAINGSAIAAAVTKPGVEPMVIIYSLLHFLFPNYLRQMYSHIFRKSPLPF
jgi:YD repeat-containing protein